MNCAECGRWHRTERHQAVVDAKAAQQACLDETNRRNKNEGPCEVCNGDHATYHCCEGCNYDLHRCHFCGDPLGHKGASACYILGVDDYDD